MKHCVYGNFVLIKRAIQLFTEELPLLYINTHWIFRHMRDRKFMRAQLRPRLAFSDDGIKFTQCPDCVTCYIALWLNKAVLHTA